MDGDHPYGRAKQMKTWKLCSAAILTLASCMTPPGADEMRFSAPTAALAPFSASDSLPAVTLRRLALGPDGAAPGGAALYLYLLVLSHVANEEKVRSAFSAYLCDVKPVTARYFTSGGMPKGIYLVPVLTDALAAKGYAPGEAGKLVTDYDYERANELLLPYVGAKTIKPDGIYLAGFNVPIPGYPTKYAIFEISGLSVADVRTWLVNEKMMLERGVVGASVEIKSVPSPFQTIISGLGETVAVLANIRTPRGADETIPCR